MNGICPPSHTIDPRASIQEVNLRPRLYWELNVIGRLIIDTKLDDSMTLKISDWHSGFLLDLKASRDEEAVRDRFIAYLQVFLCDPKFKQPLDHTALLGNDGNTYSQASLELLLLKCEEEDAAYSPYDLARSRIWTVQDHPVVQHMVRWMESHLKEKMLLPRSLYAKLDQLQQERHVRNIAAKIAQMKSVREVGLQQPPALAPEAKNEKEGREEKSEFEEKREALSARSRLLRQRLGDRLNQRGHFKEAEKRVDALRARQQADFEQMQRELEQARHSQALSAKRTEAFAQEVARQNIEELNQQLRRLLDQAIQDMAAEILELKQSIQDLRAGNGHLDELLSEEDHRLDILKQKITVVEIAALEEKKDSMSSLVSTGLIVLGSIFATWAFSAVLKGSSVGVGVAPLSKGVKFIVTKSV